MGIQMNGRTTMTKLMDRTRKIVKKRYRGIHLAENLLSKYTLHCLVCDCVKRMGGGEGVKRMLIYFATKTKYAIFGILGYLKRGYHQKKISFIGPLGHNIWWENRQSS